MRKTLIFVLLASLALCMFVGCNAEPESANYDIKATVTGLTGDKEVYNKTYYFKIGSDSIYQPQPKGIASLVSKFYQAYSDTACTTPADAMLYVNGAHNSARLAATSAEIVIFEFDIPNEKIIQENNSIILKKCTIQHTYLETKIIVDILRDVTLEAQQIL